MIDFKKYNWKVFLNPKQLLLNNLGIKQTLAKNTFWLVFAEGINKILKLILFIYIARILGATEYGKFSFALSFVSMFVIFSDLGVFKILIREFSKSAEKEKDFPVLISFKTIFDIISFLLIFIGSFFITKEPLIRTIILILGVQVLLNGYLNLFYSFFRARQKMEYQAWTQIVQGIFITGISFAILFWAPLIKNLSWAYLSGTIISLVFVLIFFHFKIFPLKISFRLSVWKEYFLLSYPIALISFLGVVTTNIDSTIMGYLGQTTATGWYNAAQRIAAASFVFVGLVSMSFFPVLSKVYFEEVKERFRKSFNYFFKAIFFLAVPITAGGIVLAPKIIDLVYDSSFLPAVFSFQILIFTFGLNAILTPFSQSLIVFNQQKKVFWVTLLCSALNIVFNFILIPKISLNGASFAFLISAGTNFIITIWLFLKYAKVKIFNMKIIFDFILVISSVLIMFLAISFFSQAYILWQILIGAIAYLIFFFFFSLALKYARLRY